MKRNLRRTIMTRPILPAGFRRLLAAALTAAVCGCAQDAAPLAELPRPVKVERIAAVDAQVAESFVGTIRAHQRADLSFESAGRIALIDVDIGDKVRAGQVLATLDATPAQERLAKAEADRTAAAAAFAERDAQWQRISQLEREQVVAAAVREGLEAQRQAALSQRQAADAALALARRELALSRIKAPFDGQIVARLAQAHADIGAAQTVLQIEAPGALEVVAALPEAVAARLSSGQKASITRPGQGDRLPVHLDKVSGRADNGEQIQAVFRIAGKSSDLRTGTTVTLDLPRPAQQAMLLPASALLPGAQAGRGQVFVLDAAQQRVALRPVEVEPALGQDGRIPLRSGIAPGEWVVVAGAPFLTDGQAATRFVPETRLQDGAL